MYFIKGLQQVIVIMIKYKQKKNLFNSQILRKEFYSKNGLSLFETFLYPVKGFTKQLDFIFPVE